jgi:hypothetical protein
MRCDDAGVLHMPRASGAINGGARGGYPHLSRDDGLPLRAGECESGAGLLRGMREGGAAMSLGCERVSAARLAALREEAQS